MPLALLDDPALKFDGFLPLYNWFYPLSGTAISPSDRSYELLGRAERRPVHSRALYVHIPFCETICSFCPFVRTRMPGEDAVELYVRALIRELEAKSRIPGVGDVAIGAIFFGGGTPSILSPSQIRNIGRTLHDHYDLSRLREFSCEIEVKSATHERAVALRDIGVTHARFGLQTFSPRYRRLFALTATVDQIREAARLLDRTFPHVSFDILYGMDGQSEEEFVADIEQAADLGLANMDFYPIDNLVTQVRLHRAYEAEGLRPTSGMTKFYMNLLLREYLAERGYVPHNGHGYVRIEADAHPDVVTEEYSFVYHEYVYGYAEYELLGFGVNAISATQHYMVQNTGSRDRYVNDLLQNGRAPCRVVEYGPDVAAAKPIATRLPYHGRIEKGRIEWHMVGRGVMDALASAVTAGLVRETEDAFVLTRTGWEWYVDLMYFLSPRDEQLAIDEFIASQGRQPGRRMEASFT